MSMLYEASAVISMNGFLHLHEYFYTVDKTLLELVQSFAITTALPLAGCRVVFHVVKYSYRGSVSEQANYGSLGKPVENTLNSGNSKYIAL